jgi:hypothetical protein
VAFCADADEFDVEAVEVAEEVPAEEIIGAEDVSFLSLVPGCACWG